MRFRPEQLAFLSRNYIGRAATCSKNLRPHVSPVYFANDSDSVFFATERDSMKFKDVSRNPFASFVVDYFDADWLRGSGVGTVEQAVMVSGPAEIHEVPQSGSYHIMYVNLFQKYPDYRAEPWNEGESPIIRITAQRILSWGL